MSTPLAVEGAMKAVHFAARHSGSEAIEQTVYNSNEKGFRLMVNLGYIVIAVSIGVMVSLQPSINAVMARELSSSLLASTISIGISFCLIFLAWQLLGKGEVEISHIRQLPWWIVFGGVAGMIFVVGGVMVAPVLGVALFFVCIIAGQVLGSTLIDQLGAFDLPVKPVSSVKLIGLGFVLTGVVLVQYGNN